MFSYEHLAAFCATVEEGSYSQAARKLQKDRTTIREQIKALEDSYAVTLFEIQGKKAVASGEGVAFYRQAKLLVRNSELLNQRMMDSYKTDYTSFDIYHDVLVPASLILHVENYIKASFPYIRVNWLHRNREEVLHQVSNTSNSMAIMQNRMSNMAEKNLGFMNLGTDKLAIYCHPKHALTNISDLTSADLQSEKQYVSENHIHTLPDVFSVSVDQHVISNNDVLLSLLVHDGWAFLSKNLAAPLVQSGHLVELHPTELSVAINIGISFYFPLSMQNSEELEGLKETLKFYSNEHMT